MIVEARPPLPCCCLRISAIRWAAIAPSLPTSADASGFVGVGLRLAAESDMPVCATDESALTAKSSSSPMISPLAQNLSR